MPLIRTSMMAPDAQGQLNEYALGKNGDIFPEASGELIKAGTKFRFGMHYHSIGHETTDRISVGLTRDMCPST
jgi:hypothetical protein